LQRIFSFEEIITPVSTDQPADEPKIISVSGAIKIIMLLAGVVAIYFAYELNDQTFLPLTAALLIVLVSGSIITILFYRVQVATEDRKFGSFLTMIALNCFSYGSILLYAFLAVNFYKADKKVIVHRRVPFVHIQYYLHKVWMANVEIEYNNVVKFYHIPVTDLSQGEYNSFNVGVAQGYFGYDVIESRELE
jgi:hypothetical protein